MSTKKDYWLKSIGEDWYNFCPELWDSIELEKSLDYIASRYNTATVYPEMSNIFRAFKLTSPKTLKVVILGQDPYPDGSATGLAFANKSDKLIPSKSLQKIFGAVERTCYDGLKVEFDITLESWAEQGVLLLNTALTFEKYSRGHFHVWKFFTENILKKLSEIVGVHFCMWGNHAKQFRKFLSSDFIYTHEFSHPAYAAYKNIDWKCEHFHIINKLIYTNNGKEEIIAW